MSDAGWQRELLEMVKRYATCAGIGPLAEPHFAPQGGGEYHVEKAGKNLNYIATERGGVTDVKSHSTVEDMALEILSRNVMAAVRRRLESEIGASPLQFDTRRLVFPEYLRVMNQCGDRAEAFATAHIEEILNVHPYS